MSKNTKIIAVGCLGLFILSMCCLAAGGVFYYFSSEDIFSPDYSDFDSSISDFPIDSPSQSEGEPTSVDVRPGEYVDADCPFNTRSTRISCGYLGVPEDHQDENSPTISLAVAIIHGSDAGSVTAPLIYLEGGPGGSALDGIEALWMDSPLIDDRDVVLVDQRGTGYSEPTLNCIEYDDPDYDEADEMDLVEKCRDRLETSGIDLNLYNSQQSAADIEALRLALGYAQVDLLGVSYGTRLALTIMRDYPQGIRSVILDSVYPPHIDALNEEILITMEALETLTDGCQADAQCRQAYPDLEDVLYELIEELEYSPAEVEFWDDYDEEYYLYDYYGLDLIYDLVDSMYDTPTIPYLPAFIYAMYDGEYKDAFEILDLPYANLPEDGYEEYTGEDVSDSEGAYFSVECFDEILFNSTAQAEAMGAGYPDIITEILLYSVEDMFSYCDQWGSQQAPSIENQPVRSEIPTLVLNGEYDPVTPPSWAVSTAGYLSRSQTFIFPGYGHAVIDELEPVCFSQVGPPDFEINP
jgi:pimeloyl-ACP methyl ester carboxylesterase